MPPAHPFVLLFDQTMEFLVLCVSMSHLYYESHLYYVSHLHSMSHLYSHICSVTHLVAVLVMHSLVRRDECYQERGERIVEEARCI